MKKYIIILVLMICGLSLKSQKISGTIKYTVIHDWLKKMETNEFMSQANRERMAYVWGQNNIWTEYSLLTFNSTTTEYKELEKYNDAGPSYSWRSDEYIIHRNFEDNRMYDVIRMLNKLYVINDTIIKINWKIKNDMREIAGHICMNASYKDTLLNKNIVAWFALDIPYSFGPETYCGLPGIILEIDMNNGAVIITAEKIEISQNEITIDKPKHKKNAKIVSKKEFDKEIEKVVEDSKKQKTAYFYKIRY